MSDIVGRDRRSRMKSRIRGRDSEPGIALLHVDLLPRAFRSRELREVPRSVPSGLQPVNVTGQVLREGR